MIKLIARFDINNWAPKASSSSAKLNKVSSLYAFLRHRKSKKAPRETRTQLMLPEEMEGSERQSRSTTTTTTTNNRASHKVLVAVKAEKVISKAALAWALTHVVHPGDCITLLAIIPKEKTSNSLLSIFLFFFFFNNSIVARTSLCVFFLNIRKC